MSNPIIEVSGLSKQYRIGAKEPYYTLRDALMNAIKSPAKLFNRGETNKDNTIWALKDVSFEIEQGERIGIIGRNGAGKTTLLKILSRITEPTKGRVTIKGRASSLLEVGTGFHPELTGRENIYLNGAILGMSKTEIKKKFDEIIAFAEIEKFLDTPVKRYSSGMYVRLAFAVAAHLEPEILIVDEVLAVGDTQFQKKCLGKMDEVSKEGRTVLFVSHNMGAIQSLCMRAILLYNGSVMLDGIPTKVVANYLATGFRSEGEKIWSNVNSAPGDSYVRINAIRVIDKEGKTCPSFDVHDQIAVEIRYWVLREMNSINTSCCFYNHRGEIIFHSRNDTMDLSEEERKRPPGFYISRCYIPPDFMNDGQVFVQVAVTDEIEVHAFEKDIVSFNVMDAMDTQGVRRNYIHEWPPAAVRPFLKWTNKKYPLTHDMEIKGAI